MALKWRLKHWLRSKNSLADALFSLIKTIVATFILLFLFSSIFWIWFEEGDIVILPAQTPPNQSYNGQAISSLLTHELIRIKEIHQTKIFVRSLKPLENYTLPDFTPLDTTIDYRLSQMGMLGQGSIYLSIGDILLTLKRILPWTKPSSILSASLQNYGTNVTLVALLASSDGLLTWQIQSKSKCPEDEIPRLVQELAYQVAYRISAQEPGSARTWQAFANCIEGWEAYQAYNTTSNLSQLELARQLALKANEWDHEYKESANLLTIIGVMYGFREGNDSQALAIFNEAIKLDPKLAEAWYNKGSVLYNLGKYNEALEAYDEAIKLDPKIAGAWGNKGGVLYNLDKYDEALEAYDEAIKIDPEFAWAWYNKGIALQRLGRTNEADTAFAKAKELGYTR